MDLLGSGGFGWTKSFLRVFCCFKIAEGGFSNRPLVVGQIYKNIKTTFKSTVKCLKAMVVGGYKMWNIWVGLGLSSVGDIWLSQPNLVSDKLTRVSPPLERTGELSVVVIQVFGIRDNAFGPGKTVREWALGIMGLIAIEM